MVNAQQRAVEQSKLLLVVWVLSGADSTGLAERFATKEMDLILRAQYETAFVDVEHLKTEI